MTAAAHSFLALPEAAQVQDGVTSHTPCIFVEFNRSPAMVSSILHGADPRHNRSCVLGAADPTHSCVLDNNGLTAFNMTRFSAFISKSLLISVLLMQRGTQEAERRVRIWH
jgi:hypothetical protein